MSDLTGADAETAGNRPSYTDVIFDYCDVLLDWRPRLALDGLYPAAELDTFFDRATEYGFWHYDVLSDLGWSEEQIIDDYAAHHHSDTMDAGYPVQLFRDYFDRQRLALYDMIDGMPLLLRDLDAAGVRLWGLTNFTAKFVHAAHLKFPWLALLCDTVVSSEEHIHKPDPEIYRRAITRFGVDPATTAFVDDKARNADAASAVGLAGIQFLNAAQVRNRLL
ncbi:HAD family hydrolase [Bifidobacterium simiiventris]|uniref:HAD family hydrolase n=1 Tax=Bifidobacterium simiiventris TaxID=2834434 RepID=UPI001C585770|nr:HAD family phosphatase [Bifidobacterium simiiventris]MBW3078660.1 HAD family phosphatase [Bifidobacterium simiiventris]